MKEEADVDGQVTHLAQAKRNRKKKEEEAQARKGVATEQIKADQNSKEDPEVEEDQEEEIYQGKLNEAMKGVLRTLSNNSP